MLRRERYLGYPEGPARHYCSAGVVFVPGKQRQSNAVCTLVALAVGRQQDLDEEAGPSETFFGQQMRKRLWITICLMDSQASLVQSLEPLVSYKEAKASFAHIQHVNNTNFDPTTTYPVPEREGLSDTTFALITYRVQLTGCMLNFTSPEATSKVSSSRRSVMSLSSTLVSGQEGLQPHVWRFEQEALGLLHFCGPESSLPPGLHGTAHSASWLRCGFLHVRSTAHTSVAVTRCHPSGARQGTQRSCPCCCQHPLMLPVKFQ